MHIHVYQYEYIKFAQRLKYNSDDNNNKNNNNLIIYLTVTKNNKHAIKDHNNQFTDNTDKLRHQQPRH